MATATQSLSTSKHLDAVTILPKLAEAETLLAKYANVQAASAAQVPVVSAVTLDTFKAAVSKAPVIWTSAAKSPRVLCLSANNKANVATSYTFPFAEVSGFVKLTEPPAGTTPAMAKQYRYYSLL